MGGRLGGAFNSSHLFFSWECYKGWEEGVWPKKSIVGGSCSKFAYVKEIKLFYSFLNHSINSFHGRGTRVGGGKVWLTIQCNMYVS